MSKKPTLQIINCDLHPTDKFFAAVDRHAKKTGVFEISITPRMAVLQGNEGQLRIVAEDITQDRQYTAKLEIQR